MVFDDGLIEIGEQDFAVAVGIGIVGEELFCIDGSAPAKGVFRLDGADVRTGNGLSCRVGDGDGEVAFAEFLDALRGCCAPRGIGRATGVVRRCVRERLEVHSGPEIPHGERGDLDDLRIVAAAEPDRAFTRSDVAHGGAGHVILAPPAVECRRQHAAFRVRLVAEFEDEFGP